MDTKVNLERQIDELNSQLLELAEEKNEQDLIIENKNACIRRLQKDLFDVSLIFLNLKIK